MEETTEEECRRRSAPLRLIFERRRRSEALARNRTSARESGSLDAAMRRAMEALTWLSDEDAEVQSTCDMESVSAGSAAGIVAGGSAEGVTTVKASGDAVASSLPVAIGAGGVPTASMKGVPVALPAAAAGAGGATSVSMRGVPVASPAATAGAGGAATASMGGATTTEFTTWTVKVVECTSASVGQT